MLIGGSPCQGFSFSGKQAGTKARLNGAEYIATDRDTYLKLKKEGAEFLSQSHLFWEYVLILDHLRQFNPNIKFMLENVDMKKELLQMIDDTLGVKSVVINSALVSAQNRIRHYWANWKIPQPEDKHIYLKDIVLDDVFPVVLHNIYGGFNEKSARVSEGKSPTLRTAAGGGHIPSFVKTDSEELNLRVFEFDRNNMVGKELEKSLPILSSDYRGLNRNQKQNAVVDMNRLQELIHSEKAIEYMNRAVKDGRTHWDFGHHSDIRNDKSSTVVANFFKGVPYNVFKDWNCIRKFHPVECERLQTLRDGYTEGISDTQRYRMIGNGWTIDVIAHIFSSLK